jgi:hypothetical protein
VETEEVKEEPKGIKDFSHHFHFIWSSILV